MLPMKVDPLPLPVLVLQLLDALLPDVLIVPQLLDTILLPVLIVPQLLFDPVPVQVRRSASASAARLLLLPSSPKLFRLRCEIRSVLSTQGETTLSMHIVSVSTCLLYLMSDIPTSPPQDKTTLTEQSIHQHHHWSSQV